MLETIQIQSRSVDVIQGCDKVCRVQSVVINLLIKIMGQFNEDIAIMDAANDYLSFRELAYEIFTSLFRVLPEELSKWCDRKIVYHIGLTVPSRKANPVAYIVSRLIRGYYEASRWDESIRATLKMESWFENNETLLPITLSEVVNKRKIETIIWYIDAPISWHPSLGLATGVIEQQLMRFRGILDKNHLSDIAHIDQLTGLANRRSLNKSFRWLLRAGDSFSVGIIDIDHFKSVNDTYGHKVGDEVLRFLWKSLRGFFEKLPQATVGRFGGEEFLVIIPWEDKSQLEMRLSEFQAYVAKEYITWRKDKNCPTTLTVSWGTSDTSDIVQGEITVNKKQGELLQKADAALYGAKNTGRNQILSWNVAAHDELLKEKAGVHIEGNRALRDNK